MKRVMLLCVTSVRATRGVWDKNSRGLSPTGEVSGRRADTGRTRGKHLAIIACSQRDENRERLFKVAAVVLLLEKLTRQLNMTFSK